MRLPQGTQLLASCPHSRSSLRYSSLVFRLPLFLPTFFSGQTQAPLERSAPSPYPTSGAEAQLQVQSTDTGCPGRLSFIVMTAEGRGRAGRGLLTTATWLRSIHRGCQHRLCHQCHCECQAHCPLPSPCLPALQYSLGECRRENCGSCESRSEADRGREKYAGLP